MNNNNDVCQVKVTRNSYEVKAFADDLHKVIGYTGTTVDAVVRALVDDSPGVDRAAVVACLSRHWRLTVQLMAFFPDMLDAVMNYSEAEQRRVNGGTPSSVILTLVSCALANRMCSTPFPDKPTFTKLCQGGCADFADNFAPFCKIADNEHYLRFARTFGVVYHVVDVAKTLDDVVRRLERLEAAGEATPTTSAGRARTDVDQSHNFGKFGQVPADVTALTTAGTLVLRVNSGDFVHYDAPGGCVKSYTSELVTHDVPAYYIPSKVVNPGDVVVHNGRPHHVLDVGDRGELLAFDLNSNKRVVVRNEPGVFGEVVFTKIVSILALINATPNPALTAMMLSGNTLRVLDGGMAMFIAMNMFNGKV